MNQHILTGQVDVTSNLLVGSSHLFVDTTNNRVGLVTNDPHAGLHVNSNAYVNTDLRVGSQIEINTTPGRVKAVSFEGDGSLLVNAPVGSLAVHSTDTGLPGTDAIVTNEGTPTAAEFKFVIPRGDVGATGTAATVAVGTTTTGVPGTNASVTNSGSSSAAVLDFTVPKGDQGIQGIQGIQGETGTAATVAVGTTTTGVPGTNASVTNTGSSSAASFDFTIPRGDTGATGPAGTVAIGTTTTGAAGSSASVTNTGTSTAANLEFTIPKGDQGIQGVQGIQGIQGDIGPAGTVAIGTTTTGAAGSSASVANTGTSTAANLEFTIPRGAQGVQGPAATVAVGTTTTGAAGTNGSVTNSGSSSAAVLDFTVPRGADGTNYFTLSGSDIYRSTGNVGIGTTSPSTRLHVNHDLYLEASSEAWNTTVGKGLYLRYSLTGGQDTAYIQSIDRSNTSLSYPMIFQGSSYEFSVGSMGIGKTPSEKLHVHENLSTSGHQIMTRIGGDTSSYNTLVFGSKEGRPHIGGHRGDFGAWADLSLQNDLMILQQSTDRVGIGVTDPDSKLEVRGNIRASFSDTNHGMFIDAGGTILRNYGGNGAGFHFTTNAIWPTNYLGAYSVGGIDLGSSTYRWNHVYTEALNASGPVTTGSVLYVGTNTNNETAKTIYFGGTYGDNAYDHCVIERRIWQTGTEKQELLLFSGNDGETIAGPDRIRLKGAQILFDTLNNSTDRTTENTKMTVKSDGVVINSGTLRKPGNPGCRVTMTGTQFTLGSGSVFPIVYNSEYHDTGNDYNTSTGKFTCPVAGKYLCIHMMTTRSSRTRVNISEVKLYHNTTETARQFQDITQDSACATNVISCAAGDTLSAGIYNADATNEFNGGTEYGSQFIVEFLG